MKLFKKKNYIILGRSPEDEGVSAPAKPASTAPKKKTTAKKPAPKKNMFAAFKEEYDKARHDD